MTKLYFKQLQTTNQCEELNLSIRVFRVKLRTQFMTVRLDATTHRTVQFTSGLTIEVNPVVSFVYRQIQTFLKLNFLGMQTL